MKRLFAYCIITLFVFSSVLSVSAADNPVTAAAGYVNVSYDTSAAEGTSVLVIVIPAIKDGNNVDVTTTKLSEIDTNEELVALLNRADYVVTLKANADGTIVHYCKTELPTDKCYVVVSYLDGEGKRAIEFASFDNVGREDIDTLVAKFNQNAHTAYAGFIADDNTGKKVLEKSGAKMSLYNTFGTDVSDFTSLLYTLKGNTDFTMTTLVNAFNEAAAYKSLWTSADTLGILSLYNTDTSQPEKIAYWTVDISETSDFKTLGGAEQTRVLQTVKDGKFGTSATLAQGFKDAVALGLFRSVTTREELTALISADGTYGAYFSEVRDVVANADLDELGLSTLYTNVLENGANASCESKGAVKTLFENSVPTSGGSGEEGSSDNSSSVTSTGGFRGGSSGGSSGKTENPTPVEPDAPFKDVKSNHWANSYIEKLYNEGVINGVGNDVFAPEATVKRQDFVKILIGAIKMELSGTSSVFSDVPSGAYYEKYIMTAYEKGLINGVSDGVFGEGVDISRQDAAVIMARILDMNNVQSGAGIAFNDIATVSSYAQEAVAKVSANKIFGGDDKNNFNPASPLSRAEACAIICRLTDLVKGV